MTETPPTDDGRGRLSALTRLWPFARPYRGLVAWTFVGALLATLAPLVVPLVTQRVVDGPIARGDRAGLVPLLALALGFGVAEAALFFLRRWAMNISSLRIERDGRDALHQRLQRLPWSPAPAGSPTCTRPGPTAWCSPPGQRAGVTSVARGRREPGVPEDRHG